MMIRAASHAPVLPPTAHRGPATGHCHCQQNPGHAVAANCRDVDVAPTLAMDPRPHTHTPLPLTTVHDA